MRNKTLKSIILCSLALGQLSCGFSSTSSSDGGTALDGVITIDSRTTDNNSLLTDHRLPEPDILTTLDTRLHDLYCYCTPLITGESIAAYNYPPEASFKYRNGCDASYAHVIYFGYGNNTISHSVFPNGLTCTSTSCTKVTNPSLTVSLAGMSLSAASVQLSITGSEQLSVGAQVYLTTSIGKYVGKGGHAIVQYNNVAPGEQITIKLIHAVMCLDGGNKCNVVIDYSMNGVFTKLQ